MTIDWESLVCRFSEGKDLEYKGPIKWNRENKKECCELVKDMIAIANSGGGWLIIGIRETDNGFEECGLSLDQVSSFESTRVNSFLNIYADPPINTRVHKPKVRGNQYVVVEIPGFSETPHLCQKDFPEVLTSPTLYVRTDNNESAPIRNSSDFRAIIERSVRNRADQILTAVHPAFHEDQTAREQFENQAAEARTQCDSKSPDLEHDHGFRETIFHPGTFLTDRLDLQELKTMAARASIDLRGWPFLYYTDKRPELLHTIQDGIEFYLAEKRYSNDELHFWQLRKSGLLYIRQSLGLVASDAGRPGLNVQVFSINAVEAIHCLIKIYQGSMDDSENITFKLRLMKMQDRMLIFPLNTYQSRDYVCQIPEITYQKTLSLADWCAGMFDHAVEICDHVFQRFNWEQPNLVESRKLMEMAINRKL